MPEQFDKDCKATTIKMLQWEVTDSLETNEKLKSQHGNRNLFFKKEPNGN